MHQKFHDPTSFVVMRQWLAAKCLVRPAGNAGGLENSHVQQGSEPAMSDMVRVYFGVYNFNSDPRVVTEAVGLEPFQAWRKGEPGPRNSRRTHDRWEFRGAKCAAAPFEDQLNEILGILEQRPDKVRRVVERFGAGIYCTAIHRETANPGFHLSDSSIRRLAGLGLSCDFDLYFLGGAGDP